MVNCSATDVLSTVPIRDVWEWYHRLAKRIGQLKVPSGTPLSSQFLTWYVSPSSPTKPKTFKAPRHLLSESIVKNALKFHRRVYLTQEKARIGGSRKWAGIRLRWENPRKYGWDRRAPLMMHYEALVQVPLLWQLTGGDARRDILYGLGLGFQLRTEVTVTVKAKTGNRLAVTYDSFQARIKDRYDFNPKEHITVPNPDYGSTEAHAICARREKMVVYHKNAQRMEKSHYAAPYDLESDIWQVTNPAVSGPGDVTL